MNRVEFLTRIETSALIDARSVGIDDPAHITEDFQELIDLSNKLSLKEFNKMVREAIAKSYRDLSDHVTCFHNIPLTKGPVPSDEQPAVDIVSYIYQNPIVWKYANKFMKVAIKGREGEYMYIIPSYTDRNLREAKGACCVFDAEEIRLIKHSLGRIIGEKELDYKSTKPLGHLIIRYEPDGSPVSVPYQDQNREELLRDWTTLAAKDIDILVGERPLVDVFSF